MHSVPAGSFEQQLDDACGRPIVYPISAKCIALMAGAGPMLQHRSDLVMAIWRSCPEENPCYRVARTEPACSGQGLTAVADTGTRAESPCLKAQQANYSCAALRDDLVYRERLRQPAPAADADGECTESKHRLSEYDQQVEDMSVHIQWYRIFAKKGR
jgi:hypothetical protein